MNLGGPLAPFSVGGPIGPNPSFFDLVMATRPELIPGRTGDAAAATGLPHGTTVLGVKYDGGVVMAGDRRATAGYEIADDRIEKVFPADDYSAIAIAGVAGQAIEIVKLFQLELEHYEKITGDRLSLEGKANRLGQMIRGNLAMAMQAGLIVVPLFGGFDTARGQGRIFYYDPTGGRWEEDDFHTTGSGGRPARTSLSKRWKPGLGRDEAVRVAIEALVDASREDVATGGPDLVRDILPSVLIVDASGARALPADEIRAAASAVLGGDA